MTGEGLFNFLLVLYPRPFRMRFGDEMLRLYRDCYPNSGPFRLWVETLKDIAVSVPREWRREFYRDDSAIDYTGLIDAFMCTVVAGTLLLGWGFMGATFVRHFGPSAGLSFIFATLAIASLVGVLSTFAAARSGRIDTSCSLLITCEKTTARFSR
ncbi:MAG TPA: hypothetical protein VK210_16890 [Terriglobia bacterium]|nr:hypothetical protein [Terriglobia bacterium]